MTERVRVRVEGSDRVADELRARLRRIERALVTDSDPALVVLRASLVRPTFTLDLDVSDDDAGRRATRLGASILAWEGSDGWSHWQRCLAPITARPLRGAPDETVRWLLLEETDAEVIPPHAPRGWQWHVLVGAPRALPDHVVQWAREPRTVAPLLGAADAIVGRDGPLLHDAWRLERPVLVPTAGTAIEHWAELAKPVLSARLAHAIPPLLAESPEHWERMLAEWSSTETLLPSMRAPLLRDAREEAWRRERGRYRALRRGLRRLRDDPRGAARDARLWLGRTLFSSARGPSR